MVRKRALYMATNALRCLEAYAVDPVPGVGRMQREIGRLDAALQALEAERKKAAQQLVLFETNLSRRAGHACYGCGMT